MKGFEEDIVDNDDIKNIVNEIKLLIKKNRDKNVSIKDIKKDYPDKIKEREETLLNYMGENDLKPLTTEFPDRWKNLPKKLAYPYEFLKCIEDYQKPVDNLKKEDFFSKSKNKCLDDEEKKRTKQFIKVINFKNGEESTQI